MNRRDFVAGSLVGLVGTVRCCSFAIGSSDNAGCRPLSALGGVGYYWSRRIESSGDQALDAACHDMVRDLGKIFDVKSGFCFFDDGKAKNALADPAALYADSPDGTVFLGIELAKSVLKLTARTGLNAQQTMYPLKMILGHEFCHIRQFKEHMDADWRAEPHADYMAGWYLGQSENRIELPSLFDGPDKTDQLETAVRVIYELGDSDFTSPAHHGQQEYRAGLVRAGYLEHHLSLDDAFGKAQLAVGLARPRRVPIPGQDSTLPSRK